MSNQQTNAICGTCLHWLRIAEAEPLNIAGLGKHVIARCTLPNRDNMSFSRSATDWCSEHKPQ
jgi:hypothetical protein